MDPTNGTTRSHAELEVVSTTDLARLPHVVDDLAAQGAAVVRHARRWVCSTDGFEPSPVCVLRPLVPVMHHLAEAFEAVGRHLEHELATLRSGVVVSRLEVERADAAARDHLPLEPLGPVA